MGQTDSDREAQATPSGEQQATSSPTERSLAVLRAVLDGVTEAVMLAETIEGERGEVVDFRVTEVNRAFEQQTGLEAARVVGSLRSEVFGPARFGAELTEVVRTGRPHSAEIFYEGLGRHFKVTVLAPAERLLAFVFDDITLRLEASKALGESERRLQLFADNVFDLIWIADIEPPRVRYISPSCERLMGHRPGEIEGQDPMVMLTSSSRKRFAESLPSRIERFKQGVVEPHTLELELKRKGGGSIWVEATFRIVNEEGGRVALYGVSRDISERRNAERAMLERLRLQEQYARVGDSVPGVICSFELGPEGSAMPFATRAAHDVFGLSPETLALDFSTFTGRVHPHDRVAFLARLEQVARQRSRWHDVFRYEHPHKGLRWLEGWASPQAGGAGSLLSHGFVMDVTEREEAERRVVRLSMLYKALSDTNEALVRASREDELFAKVCDITQRLGGFRLVVVMVASDDRCSLKSAATSGVVGALMQDITLPLDEAAPGGGALICQAFRTGRVVVDNDATTARDEGRLLRQRLGVISGVGLPLRRQGEVVGVLAIGADEAGAFDDEVVGLLETMASNISLALDNLARARALRESEERYRTLVENLDDVVFALDDEGGYTFVSPAVARWGYRPEDVIGTRYTRYVHPEDLPELEQARSSPTGPFEPREYRLFDAHGNVRLVRSSVSPVLRDGRRVGVSGVVSDITHQRETEEQLRLAQKMEAIGKLAGGVAHDFNNLLFIIGSYCELATGQLDPSSQLATYVREIERASQRAAQLTRQLLAFGRRQVLQPRPLDLNELVSSMREMLRRLIPEDIDLCIETHGEGICRADRAQVEQVLMNLVLNARDAMPGGGRVTISTDDAFLDEDYVRAHPDAKAGPYVVLAVTDEGMGLDARTRARIFEPFFTTKAMGKGTGLGLAIVYGIVMQSGGHIAVYSEVGIGSAFKVFLPRLSVERDQPAAPVAEPPSVRGTETVLVVEDESGVREVICRALERRGFRVLAASNGAEALAFVAAQGPVDLLLSDVVMPGMNGRALAEKLSEHNPAMKVVYMSGYPDDAIVHRGVLLPGTHFIGKPFSASALAKKVRAVLDGVS